MATLASMTVALGVATDGFRRGLNRASHRLHDFRGDVSDQLHSLRGSFGRGGVRSGRSLIGGISRGIRAGAGSIGSALSSVLKSPYAIAAAAAAGAVIGGAAVSAITVALGGLAVVGLSYYILKDVPKVKKALDGLKKDVKDVFAEAAKPMAEPLAKAFTRVGKIVKDLKPEFEEMFETVAKSGILKNLTGGLKGFLEGVMPGFNDMLKDMKPVFEGLETLMTKVGEGLGEFFREMGKSAPEAKLFLEDLGTVIKNALIWGGKLLGWLARIYAGARQSTEAVKALWGVFVFKAKQAWESTKETLSGVVDWFKALPGRVWGALKRFASSIKNKFTDAKNRAVNQVKTLVNIAVRFVKSLPGRAWNALSGLASNLRNRASSAGRSLVSAIRGKISDAVRLVRGLPGRAARALGNLGRRLWSSGRSLIGGFVSGIWSKIGDVARAAASVVSRARDFFPFSPAKEGPFSGRGYTTYSGAALVDGFRKGIHGGLPGLRSEIDGMYGAIPAMRADVSGVVRAGRKAQEPQRLVIDVTGADEGMKTLIRKIVQKDGRGDVQYTFGR